MNELHKRMLEWIYPRRCPICEQIVLPKGGLICEECYQDLPFVQEPYCMKCGKPVEQEEQEYCFDCQKRKFSYEYGYGMWVYDKKMQRSIAAFKYKHKKEYADFYVMELFRNYENRIRQMQVDLIVPVPMYQSKKRIRGYNQAELLAEGLGKNLGIEVDTTLLIRTKNTVAQKKLNDQERFRNLSGAFAINTKKKYEYTDKHILLIDDIYTTGSTIEVCTKVLQSIGANKVYYLSLCIGKGY